MAQCKCGRSKSYPICDGTHKIKVENTCEANCACTKCMPVIDNKPGLGTGKWSEDDDWNPITPFLGPI